MLRVSSKIENLLSFQPFTDLRRGMALIKVRYLKAIVTAGMMQCNE